MSQQTIMLIATLSQLLVFECYEVNALNVHYLVASIGTMVYTVAPRTENPVLLITAFRWVTVGLAMSLLTQALSSTLLAWRIWSSDTKVAAFRVGRGRLPVARIVLESGATLSATTALVLGFSAANSLAIAAVVGTHIQLAVSS